MKKLFAFLVVACLAVSCGNKNEVKDSQKEQSGKVSKDNSAAAGVVIDTKTIDVKLKDQRSLIESTLKEKGVKWENVGDGQFIKTDAKTDFCGVSFDGVTYVMTGDKVNMTTLVKTYYSKDEATKDYKAIISQMNEKYGKLKADSSDDEELTFTQFKDSATDFSIFLIHHSKEDMMAEAANEADKAKARENWEIDVTYEALEASGK